MIISITLKDPDGVCDSLEAAIEKSLPADLSPREREVLAETRQEEVSAFLSKWIRYGEYITVIFDTENQTATVKQANI